VFFLKDSKNKFSRVSGIASTYIHLKDVPHELTLKQALLYFEKTARHWAKEQFDSDLSIDVLVEEGSLVGRIVLGGVTIYGLIAGYGSFRSGIDHIVSDGRAFSSHVIYQFEQDYNIPGDAVVKTERRLGVPGKIQRFFKHLDQLNSIDLSHNERESEIEKLHEEFLKIIELLSDDRDRTIFQQAAQQNKQEVIEDFDDQNPSISVDWPIDPFPLPEDVNIPRIIGPKDEDA